MGECDRCGRPAYLTELFDATGALVGRYGRECLHVVVRSYWHQNAPMFRVGGRRIWVRPGRRRAQA